MNTHTHTHTILAFVAAAALVLGALFQSGCTTTGDGSDSDLRHMLWRTAQQTAVQYSVLEYAGDDIEKAARVRELVRFALDYIDRDATALLDELVVKSKEQIDWSKVSAQEQLVILTVIDIAKTAIQGQLERNELGELTPSELAAVNRMDIAAVLMWIYDATNLHAAGARAQ